MAVFNAQGLPITLLLQPDKNFGNLAATISPGATLSGRVTEVLADGRAIVNFRGIPITAELKGVSLMRGETINVQVQDLTGTPVFRMLPPATPSLLMGSTASSLPAVVAGFDPQIAAQLISLGLPLDTFHATIVQLLASYGLSPSRETAVAVKDLALRLPQLLAPPAIPPGGAAQVLAVPRMSSTLPPGVAAPVIPVQASSSAGAPATAAGVGQAAPTVPGYPQVSVSVSQGYVSGRLLLQAANLLSEPPAAVSLPAAPPPTPAVAPGLPAQPGNPAPSAAPVLPWSPSVPVAATSATVLPPLTAPQLYAALESVRTAVTSPVLQELVTQVQQALAATPQFQAASSQPVTVPALPVVPGIPVSPAPAPAPAPGVAAVATSVPVPTIVPVAPAAVPVVAAPPPPRGSMAPLAGPGAAPFMPPTPQTASPLPPVPAPGPAVVGPAIPAGAQIVETIGRALAPAAPAAAPAAAALAQELTAPDFGSLGSAQRIAVLAPPIADVVETVSTPVPLPGQPAEASRTLAARPAPAAPRPQAVDAGTTPRPAAPESLQAVREQAMTQSVVPAPSAPSGIPLPAEALPSAAHELAGALAGALHETVVAAQPCPAPVSMEPVSAMPPAARPAAVAEPSVTALPPAPAPVLAAEPPPASTANTPSMPAGGGMINPPAGAPAPVSAPALTAAPPAQAVQRVLALPGEPEVVPARPVASPTVSAAAGAPEIATPLPGPAAPSAAVSVPPSAMAPPPINVPRLLAAIAQTIPELASFRGLPPASVSTAGRFLPPEPSKFRQNEPAASTVPVDPHPVPPSVVARVMAGDVIPFATAPERPVNIPAPLGPQAQSAPAMARPTAAPSAAAAAESEPPLAAQTPPPVRTGLEPQPVIVREAGEQPVPARAAMIPPAATLPPTSTAGRSEPVAPVNPTPVGGRPVMSVTVPAAEVVEPAPLSFQDFVATPPPDAVTTAPHPAMTSPGLATPTRQPELLQSAGQVLRAPSPQPAATQVSPLGVSALSNGGPAAVPANPPATVPTGASVQSAPPTPLSQPPVTRPALLPPAVSAPPFAQPRNGQTVSVEPSSAQATPEPVPVPPSLVPGPARPPTVAPQVIETAVFMVARDLPATSESAAAAQEYLFSEPKLPDAMQRFTAAARATALERLPAPLRQAVTRALEAVARATVSPEADRLPEQLKTAVESIGLDHEARLASAEPAPPPVKADAALAPAPVRSERSAPAGRSEPLPIRESLKAALLEVKSQADQAMRTVTAPAARTELMNLRSAAHDIIQSVQAQQVGGVNQPSSNSSLVYVQIPLVLGAELRGGDIQVSWGKERKNKKRDPRVPAQMTMQLETRSLGLVDVSMKMVGNALSLIFRVFDTEVQGFIRQELPGLVDRLTGFKYKVDQAVCEVRTPPPQAAPTRAVRATSSLDLKA